MSLPLFVFINNESFFPYNSEVCCLSEHSNEIATLDKRLKPERRKTALWCCPFLQRWMKWKIRYADDPLKFDLKCYIEAVFENGFTKGENIFTMHLFLFIWVMLSKDSALQGSWTLEVRLVDVLLLMTSIGSSWNIVVSEHMHWVQDEISGSFRTN